MKNGMYLQANGDKVWFKDNILHREDGPAVIRANGTRQWYINGKIHRENGPAVEAAHGNKGWYITRRWTGYRLG